MHWLHHHVYQSLTISASHNPSLASLLHNHHTASSHMGGSTFICTQVPLHLPALNTHSL